MINLDTERMEGGGPDHGHNLLHGLNDLCKKYIKNNMKVLELGCHKGVSTELFSQYAHHVDTCDLQDRPQRLDDLLNVTHHQGHFKDLVKSFPPDSFDFIYLDGMHDRESIMEDLNSTLPLLKQGGLIGGHDYYTDVKEAVEAVLGGEPEVFSDSSWVNAVKPEELPTNDNSVEKDLYLWPNPYFPFLRLLDGSPHRIFLISNLTHNYRWLKTCARYFKKTDYFFVSFGWALTPHLCDQASWMFEYLKLNKEQFFLLYNTPEEKSRGEKAGFRGAVINNNAWLNSDQLSLKKCNKIYDACYIARAVKFKRHELCATIDNLALAAGDSCSGSEGGTLPPCKNDPSKFLNRDEISHLCAQSHCGLIFSEIEGACYASSEYLLCGIPVISTISEGGRHMWYNEHNSILCEDTPEAVAAAVAEAKERSWNPSEIRKAHILQAAGYQSKFCGYLQEALKQIGLPSVDANSLFNQNNRLCHWEQVDSTTHINDLENYFKRGQ